MIIIVKKCADCPFCWKDSDFSRCSVSTPKHRPVDPETPERPSFCPLRREQAIVREFS